MAAAGDRLVAVWTAPGTSRWGSGALASAISADGGKNWVPGPAPNDDAGGEGHGYLDLTAGPDGVFHAVWLDGRDGGQGLRAARSTDGGRSWEPNRTIDRRTCECCWNRLLAGEAGAPRVIYRDRDPRDLAVAGSDDGGATWRRLGTAGAFDWTIEGCPHVGGSLARTRTAAGETLHAMAWTGAREHTGLYLLASGDGGASWSDPRPLPDPRAHHGDLAADGAALAAVWDSVAGDARVIRAARSADGGVTWGEAQVLSKPEARASHPLVVAVDGGFLAAWTEGREGRAKAWRAVRLEAGSGAAGPADRRRAPGGR